MNTFFFAAVGLALVCLTHAASVKPSLHTEGDGPLGAAEKYCTKKSVKNTITCACANVEDISNTVLPSVCKNWAFTNANACKTFTTDGELDVSALETAVDMVLQNCMFEEHDDGTMEAAEGSDGSRTVSRSVAESVKMDIAHTSSRFRCAYQCGFVYRCYNVFGRVVCYRLWGCRVRCY